MSDNYVGVPYSNDTTSKEAAKRMLPYVGGLRKQVAVYIASRGQQGATDQECQDALHMGPQTQTARRNELAEMGIIVSIGSRKTRAKNDADVWIINPELDEGRIQDWLAKQKAKKKIVIPPVDIKVKDSFVKVTARGITLCMPPHLLDDIVDVFQEDTRSDLVQMRDAVAEMASRFDEEASNAGPLEEDDEEFGWD